MLYVHIRPIDTSAKCAEKADQRVTTSLIDQSMKGNQSKGVPAGALISSSQKCARHSQSTSKKASCVRQPKAFAKNYAVRKVTLFQCTFYNKNSTRCKSRRSSLILDRIQPLLTKKSPNRKQTLKLLTNSRFLV